MTARTFRLATYGLAVLALGLWMVDIVRQLQLGVADSGLAFYAVAGVAAVVVAVAVARQPGRERMALLIAVWLVISVLDDLAVDWPVSRTAATVWMLAHGLAPAAYGLMVLTYPSGRLRARGERLLVALAAFVGLVWMGAPLLFFRPGSCSACAPRVSSLFYTGHTFDYLAVGQATWTAFIVIGGFFVVLLVRRLRAAPPGAQLTLLPLGLAVFFTAAEFVAQRVVWLGGWQSPGGALDWIDRLNALVLPLAIFVGLAAIRRRRGPLGDLVVELERAPPGRGGSRAGADARRPDARARALAPGAAARSSTRRDRSNELPTPEGRAVTVIGPPRRAGRRAHPRRPAARAATRCSRRPAAAARLALENNDSRPSCARSSPSCGPPGHASSAPADEERRRLERDLHDGAQQRLLALGLALQLAPRAANGDQELLAQAEAELRAALDELRDLARGIHPTILSEQGLGPAVRCLADRSPVPVQVESGDERYPASVETAAYFVIAEALANIAKHAQARSAVVSLAARTGSCCVDVTDDGRGGAVARSRRRAAGAPDRVAAAGGTLTIASDAGRGTVLHAEIPCAS